MIYWRTVNDYTVFNCHSIAGGQSIEIWIWYGFSLNWISIVFIVWFDFEYFIVVVDVFVWCPFARSLSSINQFFCNSFFFLYATHHYLSIFLYFFSKLHRTSPIKLRWTRPTLTPLMCPRQNSISRRRPAMKRNPSGILHRRNHHRCGDPSRSTIPINHILPHRKIPVRLTATQTYRLNFRMRWQLRITQMPTIAIILHPKLRRAHRTRPCKWAPPSYSAA